MKDCKTKSGSAMGKSYEKYRCQYKRKPILTKLSEDAGYPQQILTAGVIAQTSSDNFIEANMKNLRNFFEDRIPVENTLLSKLMKRQVSMISPKRISEIKKLQYELKSRTKMQLPQSIQVPQGKKDSAEFKKVRDNFQVNDKNKELKEMYGTRVSFSHYERDNFRRGTRSYIQKRSKVLKKQAYDDVFGPDPSSFSRTVVTKDSEPSSASPRKSKSISLSAPGGQGSPRRRLRELISNLNDFKNKLQEKEERWQMGEYREVQGQLEQTQMVTVIRDMARGYQVKSVKGDTEKMEQLQDVRKISQKFYRDMVEHKRHRLDKRKEFISSTVTITPQASQLRLQIPYQNSLRSPLDNESHVTAGEEQQQELEGESVTDKQDLREKTTVKYRYQLLKKTLVRWAALIYIYGVRKTDLYVAFQNKREPYQMEGSYAFFKCIKQGDIESVRTFISANSYYVYEVDFHGRSALSYACYYNQTEIVKEILKVGVHSDRLCNAGRTSLWYAISRRNVAMVRELLQRGAAPWSTSRNPYNRMILQGENRQQLSILFSNAKKIYLRMQIQPTILQRKQSWNENRMRIVEDHLLTYEYQ